ncbi:MFS transporter [Pseudovibrio axinellae]|uniref:MFS transporter n=1 Tax=Pseudovibrio axinellae TaxID=989403 RepID=UPI00094224D3
MISLKALSVHAVLPALSAIGRDLDIVSSQNIGLITSGFFLGLSPGQLILGPASDRFGRKPTIYAGTALFVLGSILTTMATVSKHYKRDELIDVLLWHRFTGTNLLSVVPQDRILAFRQANKS